jgi:FkbM family methyltransferase
VIRLPNGADLRLWSRGDDWISTQIFWSGLAGFEPEVVPVFLGLAARAQTTVDVGAYIGYFSVMGALANPRATVVALEPYPPTYERLLKNVRANGLANVTCRNEAAGAVAGTARLHHRPTGYSPAASLNPSHISESAVATTDVPVVALDELLPDLGVASVDLIKVDTETTEPEVLAGARETLARHRPHIICEVLDGHRPGVCEELTALLQPLGYRFYELTVDGLREHSAVVPAKLHNYLFSPLALEDMPPFPRL